MRIRSLQHRYARLLLLPLCSFSLACSEGELIAAPLEASLQAVQSEKIVGGGGLNLAVYEAGKAEGPPIVFIHGFSGNHLTWERQFAGPLTAEFRLVAYDLRGHGASDKPLEAVRYTNSALWADDLAAVIRAKNLNRPVLVGWSYGGYVIADYIRKFGDSGIRGVVFLGSTTKNGTKDAAEFLTPEVLAGIRVPTLAIHGTGDRIVRVSAARHTARTVPKATLLLYDGVGHAPHLEIPERLSRDLAEFVRARR